MASLLRGGGSAYLFWNGWHLEPQVHDVDAIGTLSARQGHGLEADLVDHRSATAWAESEIQAESTLRLMDTRRYVWPWSLPVDDYLGLLRTTSHYAVADVDIREPLLAALRELLGDQVTLRGATGLLHIDVHDGS